MPSFSAYKTIFPRCPWCLHPAKVWLEDRAFKLREGQAEGWIAGCTNAVHAWGPPSECLVRPQTLPMTTRVAAVREWRKILTRRNAPGAFQREWQPPFFS